MFAYGRRPPRTGPFLGLATFGDRVAVDGDYVRERLGAIAQNRDLSQYIL